MTRRRWLFGALALTVLVPAAARADEPARERLEGEKLDPLLAEIANARKSLKSLRANFTQERKMVLLATSVKSTGQLAFVAPDRLRWELFAPDDVIYWVGPEGLSYRTRSSKATLPSAGANVAKGLADLRALLGGDLGTLRERYVLVGSKGPNDVEIVGTAKDPTAAVRGFTLVLDKSLVVPVRARLLEGKTDTVDIAFSNATPNAPIDPKIMRP
ncbi:hypothetical protein AKJ09_01265 [Labilithrix luteola]|uniref:Outer membrane lipoprotein carrier protein LolA n=1 Tax=Labilithrix luteola TaxID=1391654 RepID=A0A0K1PMG1_9BACT|nr:outer membrane lipoprotein carrier protein LolA [Labilithrix luteola]AKU94601.1 hypothetical protein AKJ09_01265 [Labilithrix luteola]